MDLAMTLKEDQKDTRVPETDGLAARWVKSLHKQHRSRNPNGQQAEAKSSASQGLRLHLQCITTLHPTAQTLYQDAG